MFRIFDKLGGLDEALNVVERERKGHTRPSPRALRDWRQRGSIPGINALILLRECASRGVPATFEDCRLPEKPKPQSFPRPQRGQGRAARP